MKKGSELLAVAAVAAVVISSCGVKLPDSIYDEPSTVSGMPGLVRNDEHTDLTTASENVIADFSRWLPEEKARYEFAKQLSDDCAAVAVKIRKTSDEKELEALRDEVYSLAEKRSEFDYLYEINYGAKIEEAGEGNLEFRKEHDKIDGFLNSCYPDFSALLEQLPCDWDREFRSRWATYYREACELEFNMRDFSENIYGAGRETAESKKYKIIKAQMEEVLRLYENGSISGEHATNAVFNLHNS